MGTFGRRPLVLAVALIFWHAMAAAQTAPQAIGKVAALRGSATGHASAGAASTPLVVGETLTEGETVDTGPDSRLKLALRDGSVLTLGADAELKLDHLSLGAGATTFTQTSGYLRAVVAPVRPDAEFEIHTPSMVAAVRGTEWIENYAAGATQLFVRRGRVRASGVGAYAGDSVVLTAGEGVTFSLAAPHTPVSRWKAPKIRLFEEATSLR